MQIGNFLGLVTRICSVGSSEFVWHRHRNLLDASTGVCIFQMSTIDWDVSHIWISFTLFLKLYSKSIIPNHYKNDAMGAGIWLSW